jgi:SH3-like domain-containing protein
MNRRPINLLVLLLALTAATGFRPGFSAYAGPGPAIPGFGPSGLPLPRFVSLGTDKVYVRTGPGKQYPIDWVYVRRNMPVEVIAEYDIWRRIRDHDGSSGWAHGSMLSGRRTVSIQGGTQTVYHKPDPQSWPVMRAEEGVIAELKRCQPGWCEIKIEGKKGWVRITGIWGTAKADIRE